MKLKYAVTFEFPERQPLTHRGEVEAGSPATCGNRAIREARKALAPRGWCSVVCFLERAEIEDLEA